MYKKGLNSGPFYVPSSALRNTMAKNKKIIPITPENKCSFCKGTKCCSYISQQIDTPRTIEAFDFLAWQLSHRDVQLYKDEDGWFLLINNPCQHIQADGGCGIYQHRPQICRDYENDYCEYDEPAEQHFELYFRNYDELNAYCSERFKRWQTRWK